MDELSAKIPALKPWLESHREEFLTLFRDYHECSQKSIWKKALVLIKLKKKWKIQKIIIC